MKRLLQLDGLRGIAVALVLGNHFLSWPTGGMGVDLFFALSGFLITTILLSEKHETHFWRIFYLRRLTRILPAFLVLLLFCSVVAHVRWRVLAPYILLTGSNLASVVHEPEMFAADMMILWSLCVEEHFYFAWPAVVRRLSQQSLAMALFGVLLAGPVLRFISFRLHQGWDVRYYLTPFHLDGIALGCLLAIALEQASILDWLKLHIGGVTCTWLAVTAALYRWFFHNSPLPVSVGPLALGIASALLVAYLVLRPQGIVSRILSIRPLIELGRISYGLYLFHTVVKTAVFELASRFGFRHAQRVQIAAIVLSIAFAWLSFYTYESWFLRLGRRRSNALKDGLVSTHSLPVS